jgi:hypothetical protein
MTVRTLRKYNDNNFNQFCAFKVLLKKPLNIVLIYRPPNSGFANTEELCKLIEGAEGDTILIGDFNYPEIDWNSNTTTARSQPIIEAIAAKQMQQLIYFPTHTKGNVLDLVITNCGDRILNVEDGGRLGRSDHAIINVTVAAEIKEQSHTAPRHNWLKADLENMRKDLRQKRWNINGNTDIEGDWRELKDTLRMLTDKYVPVLKPRIDVRPRWLSRDIIKLIRQKKSAWKEAKYHNAGPQLERYKRLEKEVANKIRNAKRKIERELAFGNDKNGKKFSSYVKSKTKSRTGIGPLRAEDGTITADGGKMANTLNEYFSSVFSTEDTSNLPVKNRETDREVEHITFERAEILKTLKNLKQSAAPGPDGISPKILKEMRFEIADVLQKIYQKSIDSGTVPADWKKATVTPIYKKGTKSDPANYRPVSLTSIPCKVMETIIKVKIMTHLQQENLIKPSQHGFWPGRSCATNLLLFQDALTKAVDNGTPADIFYLDFEKAFDKVPRERLIIKLEAKGITGRMKGWIRAWLTGRTQVVIVQGEQSDESSVDSGVTQGTVLGPLLFTVHIDDIDDFVRWIELLKKFADDTKGLKLIRNLQDREALQRTLDELCWWAEMWGMQYNIEKCKIMHVGRSNPGYEYSMNGKTLRAVSEETDIGVIVQSNLKPGKQCQRAANVATGVLKQYGATFTTEIKKYI